MPKLHEILSVEGQLKTQADKVRGELATTFEKKRHLFEEKRIVSTPLGEGGLSVVESQSDIQSTVEQELKSISPFLQKALDASYQVAEANTIARADVILEDGKVLLKDVPATALLELEKRLSELLALFVSIPTLDPAKGFTIDESRAGKVYQARPVTKTRTRKDKVVLIKYEATDKHPAQTELIDKDVPVARLEENEWSGLITPARKSDFICRVEEVSRAVRQARSRANDVEVDKSKKIGNEILTYILKDVK